MEIDYLACGKCNSFLRVVAPKNDFTTEMQNNGGEIDSIVIFQCPRKVSFSDEDDGHTRIILDLAKIIETGRIIG